MATHPDNTVRTSRTDDGGRSYAGITVVTRGDARTRTDTYANTPPILSIIAADVHLQISAPITGFNPDQALTFAAQLAEAVEQFHAATTAYVTRQGGDPPT